MEKKSKLEATSTAEFQQPESWARAYRLESTKR
jgi:hypothetical protein